MEEKQIICPICGGLTSYCEREKSFLRPLRQYYLCQNNECYTQLEIDTDLIFLADTKKKESKVWDGYKYKRLSLEEMNNLSKQAGCSVESKQNRHQKAPLEENDGNREINLKTEPGFQIENDDFFEKFYRMAEKNPDECLSLISDMIEKDESMESNPILRLCRAIANMNKGVNLFKEKNEWEDGILDIFEQSLKDLKVANDIEPKLDIFKGETETKIDALGEIFEIKRPGKIQELLGKTKLKYFRSGESRISKLTSIAEHLIPSDEALDIFGNVFFEFPYIVGSAVVALMMKEDDGRHYIRVVLYEEKSPRNAFGEPNEIKGQINIYEDGTFKIVS